MKIEQRRLARDKHAKGPLSKRSAPRKGKKKPETFQLETTKDHVFQPYKGDVFGTAGNYMGT